MEIYAVTGDYIGAVKSLFKPHEVKLLPRDFSDVVADLVVFSGGEDVDPSLYGSNKIITWGNPARDKWELSVLEAIQKGKLKAKKVLGICRGLQLINVGMGGSLVYDILEAFGTPHRAVHSISWTISSALSEILPVVNSMHHQGIQYIGENLQYKILAKEPSTGIIEAILWENKYLAFQFHPEFFPDGDIKSNVAKILCDWVLGDDSMFSAKQPSYKSPSNSVSYKFTGEWTTTGRIKSGG